MAGSRPSGKYSGEASVVSVQSIDNLVSPQLISRFGEAREHDYQELLHELQRISTVAPTNVPPGRISRLRARFREIVEIDFFGCPFGERVEQLLSRVEAPPKVEEPASRIRLKDYIGRVWVTRPRPGIDRSASAWLIRRFIDKKARFAFAKEDSVPRDAIPYDMFRGKVCLLGTGAKTARLKRCVKTFAFGIQESLLWRRWFTTRI